MSDERRSDRRQGYSFLGHVGRVIRAKGLHRVFLSLGSTVLVAALLFAYCSKNTITGPSAPSGSEPKPIPKSTTSTSAPKQAIAVFPTNLLPTVHPCDPTLTFTDMQGENDIDYTDEILYNPDGTRSGQHKITYNSSQKQHGKDKNGYNYSGNKYSSGQSFIITNRYTTVEHFSVNPLDANGNAQPCTTTYNFQSNQQAGNCFKSNPTYDWLLVEDPLTGEGTLTVTTVAITSECPTTVVSMREP